MERRTLAGTDLEVSRVVLGTMTFGAQVDAAAAERMVATALDAGITMFDTSNNYAGGASEEILGRVLKPVRDEVLVSTKVGSHVDLADARVAGLSPTAVRHAVEGSLRRLGVDRIDVLHLHRPDPDTPIEETLASLDELVRSGVVAHIGQSNFAAWQIADMIHLAHAHGWPPILVSQPQYNLLSRRIEGEYATCAQRFGLSNVPYNPLAGGLLTGKYDEDPGAGRAAGMIGQPQWAPAVAAGRDLAALARDIGVAPASLAMAFALLDPSVTTVLFGATRPEQIRANLGALALAERLTPGERDRLAAIGVGSGT